MALRKRYCANHPDRPAIGICVVTHKPICAECSTRYEGVNYSKEGLEILRNQRARQGSEAGLGERLGVILVVALCPVFIGLLYLFYLGSADLFVDLMHVDLTP